MIPTYKIKIVSKFQATSPITRTQNTPPKWRPYGFISSLKW